MNLATALIGKEYIVVNSKNEEIGLGNVWGSCARFIQFSQISVMYSFLRISNGNVFLQTL
jgi:hypothetical protein